MTHAHQGIFYGKTYISIMIMMVVTIHSKIVMMTTMGLTIETTIVHKDLFCGYLVPLPIKMETAVMTQLKTMIAVSYTHLTLPTIYSV